MQLEKFGVVEEFARAARDLYAAPEEIDQLQLGVDLAVKLIAGCDHASFTCSEAAGASLRWAPTTWYAAVMRCNTSLTRARAWMRYTAI